MNENLPVFLVFGKLAVQVPIRCTNGVIIVSVLLVICIAHVSSSRMSLIYFSVDGRRLGNYIFGM